MKLYVLEREMLVPVSIRETFEFFQDPHNLALITPPSLGFQILTPDPIRMRCGAEIDYRIRLAGIPVKWKTIITEYEPPFFFIDEQVRGPYRFWRHRHSFRPTEGGTVVSDRVEYALPFGWIGRIVHCLAVRRRLQHIFAYRQTALTEMLRRAPSSR